MRCLNPTLTFTRSKRENSSALELPFPWMRQKDCHLSVYRVLQIKEETYKVIGTFISKMNNCRTHEHPSLRPYSTPDYTGHSVNQPIGPFALKSESNKYKPEYTSVYTGNVINRSHWMSLFLLLVECHFPGIWFASCCNKTLIQILKCISIVSSGLCRNGQQTTVTGADGTILLILSEE